VENDIGGNTGDNQHKNNDKPINRVFHQVKIQERHFYAPVPISRLAVGSDEPEPAVGAERLICPRATEAITETIIKPRAAIKTIVTQFVTFHVIIFSCIWEPQYLNKLSN
jgi:hypothetical protein